jgi:hypothetical protein
MPEILCPKPMKLHSTKFTGHPLEPILKTARQIDHDYKVDLD